MDGDGFAGQDFCQKYDIRTGECNLFFLHIICFQVQKNAQSHQADLRHGLNQDDTRRDGAAGKMVGVKPLLLFVGILTDTGSFGDVQKLIHETEVLAIRHQVQYLLSVVVCVCHGLTVLFAAIDGDGGAVDPTRFVAAHQVNDIGHIGGGGQSAEWVSGNSMALEQIIARDKA